MKVSSICESCVRKYTPYDIDDNVGSGRSTSIAENHPVVPAVQVTSVSSYQIDVHSRSAIRRVPRYSDAADVLGVFSEPCDQFLFRIHFFIPSKEIVFKCIACFIIVGNI
jgi:uncharacterized SAM-dependent methyltransferase